MPQGGRQQHSSAPAGVQQQQQRAQHKLGAACSRQQQTLVTGESRFWGVGVGGLAGGKARGESVTGRLLCIWQLPWCVVVGSSSAAGVQQQQQQRAQLQLGPTRSRQQQTLVTS